MQSSVYNCYDRFSLFLLLLVICTDCISAQCSKGTESFLLSTNTRLSSTSYDRSYGGSLTDCTKRCRWDDRCRSITFFRNSTDTMCQLMDVTTATARVMHDDNLTPVHGTYYLEKMCLQGACDRLFVAESLPGMELTGHDDQVLTNTDRQSCLEACLLSKDIVCRSAEFDTTRGECRLSRHDRFSRQSHFKKSEASTEYFDVTCPYNPDKNGAPKSEDQRSQQPMKRYHAHMNSNKNNSEMYFRHSK